MQAISHVILFMLQLTMVTYLINIMTNLTYSTYALTLAIVETYDQSTLFGGAWLVARSCDFDASKHGHFP